jgi:hypothetical protein
VKRTNVFKVTSSTALEKDMAEKVLNTLGLSVNGVNSGQMALPGTPAQNGTTTVSSTAGSVDFELGEDDRTGEAPVTVSEGTPVKDPVLARFLSES